MEDFEGTRVMTNKDNSNAGQAGDQKQWPLGQRLLEPRASIIVNTLLLAVAIAGLVAVAQGQKDGRVWVLLAMLASWTQGAAMRTKQVPLDERESMVLANATATGSSVTSGLVALWCVLIGLSGKGLWYPDSSLQWQTFGLFMFGLTSQASNIATALMTPSYAAELLDEE